MLKGQSNLFQTQRSKTIKKQVYPAWTKKLKTSMMQTYLVLAEKSKTMIKKIQTEQVAQGKRLMTQTLQNGEILLLSQASSQSKARAQTNKLTSHPQMKTLSRFWPLKSTSQTPLIRVILLALASLMLQNQRLIQKQCRALMHPSEYKP